MEEHSSHSACVKSGQLCRVGSVFPVAWIVEIKLRAPCTAFLLSHHAFSHSMCCELSGLRENWFSQLWVLWVTPGLLCRPPSPRLCLRMPSLHLCSVYLRKTVVFAFRITQKISLFSSGSFLSYNHEDSSPRRTSLSPEWALWVDLGEDHHLTHYNSSVLLTLKYIGQTMIILEFETRELTNRLFFIIMTFFFLPPFW